MTALNISKGNVPLAGYLAEGTVIPVATPPAPPTAELRASCWRDDEKVSRKRKHSSQHADAQALVKGEREGGQRPHTVVVVGVAARLRAHRVVLVAGVRGVAARRRPVWGAAERVQLPLEGAQRIPPRVRSARTRTRAVEQRLTGVAPRAAHVRPAAVVVALAVGVGALPVGSAPADVGRAAGARRVARALLRRSALHRGRV